MEKDMKELVLDYIEGNLKGELKEYVKIQIEKNDDFRKAYTETKLVLQQYSTLKDFDPPVSISDNFHDFLNKEIRTQSFNKRYFIQSSFLKIAASILLLAIGAWIGSSLIKTSDTSNSQLVEQALFQMKAQSASDRIHAINASGTFDYKQDVIIDALFFTLNFDENTNVRLSALNALSKFTNEVAVKHELINSLKFQDNPTIQIALINLLVDLRERQVILPLQELLKQDHLEDFVRDEAQMGIFKLS